ncbi:carbohydrate ABC transporter permease [Occultella aeris]|uniref:L-arabinose transport system permease protein AraP n=1 Tax=Occultella aeris TaxID=2761496 RepID=A0A7M4DRV2_9MICO|nr:sugar ABC transporter permease [Occultella aeris]VZO40196.1 L-arabinose transport system permease protein AraP [Occultella aeris]
MVALDDPPAVAHRSSPTRRRQRSPMTWLRRGGLTTLVFFLPLLLSFAYFSWWPILRSLVLSLQQTNFIVTEWVGLANFERVLADPLLLTAVWNTTYFTLLAVAIGFPVPILLAVLIAEMRRTRGFASVLAYLPVIIPPVVSVLLWKTFYRPDEAGLFNTILGWFGLGPLPWLNDPNLVIPAIVVQATWASFGTAVIIYLATLMTIRTELYEAAEIDGASILRRFWHVTLPQMRGILLIMLLLQLIGTFQVFTEPYIMTGGGPENRSMTLLLLIYRYAFVSGDYGRATALSLLLALALSLLSAIYLWATRRWSTS